MNAAIVSGPAIGPVPIEFILFGCVLAGVALVHADASRGGETPAAVQQPAN